MIAPMLPVRTTLTKIFREVVRREGSDGVLVAWPLACGARIADRTSAVSFADGVLTVAVPDEAWRQELQSFIPQYLAALNLMVSEPVNRIDFRTWQRER